MGYLGNGMPSTCCFDHVKLIIVEPFRLKPPVGHLDRNLRRLSYLSTVQ